MHTSDQRQCVGVALLGAAADTTNETTTAADGAEVTAAAASQHTAEEEPLALLASTRATLTSEVIDSAVAYAEPAADQLRQEWARPASDLAAKRLADQRRRVSDLFDNVALPEPHVNRHSDATLPAVDVDALPTTTLPLDNPTGLRAFIHDHLASMALALSLVVCVVTAVATLSVTGSGRAQPALPAPTRMHGVATEGTASDPAQRVRRLPTDTYLAENAARQALHMERSDYLEWPSRTETALAQPAVQAPHAVSNALSWALLPDLTPVPLPHVVTPPLGNWNPTPDGCRCPTVTQLQTDANATP
jgi:hypothetical protein